MRQLNARDIELSILKLTKAVEKKSFGSPRTRPAEWWVMAVGEAFGSEDMEGRDQIRDKLLDQVKEAGVTLDEHIWVWDDLGCAQLVIATYNSQILAHRLASRLESKGLCIRIKEAMQD